MPPARPQPDKVSFRIEETPEIPLIGLLFGWSAMLPFVFGAIAAWVMQPGSLIIRLTIIWGGAILSFLAGVRRGLSFRTPGGEDVAEIATMLWLFILAIAALALPWALASLVLLIIGYVSVAVLDPLAARRREAPLFFSRLRPVQMLVPIACLAALVCRVVFGG